MLTPDWVPLARESLPLDPAAARLFVRGAQVAKLHAARTDQALLRRRLGLIGQEVLAPLWLQPVNLEPEIRAGRLLTLWPRVEVLAPASAIPWREAGSLLAALHNRPLFGDPPEHGGKDRLARAVAWLGEQGEQLRWLHDLGDGLLQAFPRERLSWLHGDFHLGQLGNAGGGWVLLDPDDLGAGHPAWDLGRPAGFWAAGLLDDASWGEFLSAYVQSGGPGVPAEGNPWPALDFSARAAVVIAATRCVRSAPSEPTAKALLKACRRMAESRA